MERVGGFEPLYCSLEDCRVTTNTLPALLYLCYPLREQGRRVLLSKVLSLARPPGLEPGIRD